MDLLARLPRRWRLLNSRITWRLFGVFLAATTVPALLLGVLVHLDTHAREQGARQAVMATALRGLTMQTLERLLLADAELQAVAVHPGAAPAVDGMRALRSVAVADRGGQLQLLRGSLAVDPASLAPPGPLRAGYARVVVDREPRGGTRVLVVRDGADGRAWIGQVDEEWLWRHAGELPGGMQACARTLSGVALWCSDAQAGAAIAAAPADASTKRELFIPSRFDGEAWSFSAAVPPQTPTWLTRAQLPAAIATLLVAVLLTSSQLRRTMQPLERLSAAARAWHDGRFEARVAGSGNDGEFASLTEAFNAMAGRLQADFRHQNTLRRIDGLVLAEDDAEAALEQVARDVLARWLTVRGLVCIARQLPGREGFWGGVAVAGPHSSRRGRWRGTGDAGVTTVNGTGSGLGSPMAPPPGLVQWLGAAAMAMTWWPLVVKGRVVGLMGLGDMPEPGAGLGGPPQALPDPAKAARDLGFQEVCARMALALDAMLRESRLRHEAAHDSLTQLPNRAGMIDRLEASLVVSGAGGPPVSVLFIDLDRFKAVNDGHGHQVGDKLLQLVAERLVRLVGSAGFVSRPAGDEFVIVVDQPVTADFDMALGRAVCSELSQRLPIGTLQVQIGASIGLARGPKDSLQAAELLRMADLAMYQAKRAGRSQVCRYEPALDAVAQRRLWVESELGDAVLRNELMLMYQPRLDVASGHFHSAEALVRWVHPKRGMISPGEFIPIAEESALIERIGHWVLDSACSQLAAWRDGPLADLRVAVNVSARQLASDRFVTQLHHVLRRHGIAPQRLEIEVTESLLADDVDSTIRRLQAIRDLGVTLALDDFGTGYSSLSYLRRLPVDIMKIDRSFVIDIPHVRSAQAVAHSIIALAGALGKTIVAEGVETPDQARWLREAGCQELQGYLFGKPMRPEALLQKIGGFVPQDRETTAGRWAQTTRFAGRSAIEVE